MNFNILLILTEQSKHAPPCPVWSLSPVRLRGLSGSRGWRPGDAGFTAGCLGEREVCR